MNVVNDNILALFSQIVLDKHIEPLYSILPRFALIVGGQERVIVPHMRLLNLVFNETFSIQQLNSGFCVKRVVWGIGPRLIYNDALIRLRRETADFVRELVRKFYHPVMPAEFSISGNSVPREDLLLRRGRQIRIVIMSRGHTGQGRSIKGEASLKSILETAGALVAICCNFQDKENSYRKQLTYAYYADVIVGLHGAGLTNAIFSPRSIIMVELKTVYAYGADLFLKVTDARQGVHLHIDTRRQSDPKNDVHVMDTVLIGRILSGLVEAISLSNSSFVSGTGAVRSLNINRNNTIATEGGFQDLLVSTPVLDSLDADTGHILGPKVEKFRDVCQQLVYAQYRSAIKSNGRHCLTCGES